MIGSSCVGIEPRLHRAGLMTKRTGGPSRGSVDTPERIRSLAKSQGAGPNACSPLTAPLPAIDCKMALLVLALHEICV